MNLISQSSDRPDRNRLTSEVGDRPRKRGRKLGALAAEGESVVWLTGGALVITLVMIFGLTALIVYQGSATFWPQPLEQVWLREGGVLLGEIARDEKFQLDELTLKRLSPSLARAARVSAGRDDGWLHRSLYRTGNYELTGVHFQWVADFAILKRKNPRWAMVVERRELGRFYGIPETIIIDGKPAVQNASLEGVAQKDNELKLFNLFHQYHREVVERRQRIKDKEKSELGGESYRSEKARLAMRKAELKYGDHSREYKTAVAYHERIVHETKQVYSRVRQDINQLREENKKFQIIFFTTCGEEVAIGLADIVRMYPANQLTWIQKTGVYLSRWREFLWEEPREANSEGGVWPAIVGTVSMTLLMAIAVVPFGVLASLYLREYAKPGLLISAVRIAINNLAGVPSIVFGVFGLGFLCYIIGSGLDEIFFPENVADGNPVYGKGALVWASMTLALLTLPVVIVASEEALASVPNSMREGSYACGGSKWQTIRRVVLPQAMPGIMTGVILAMARGAGEVAPLMLVGAVKLAPELPIDNVFPFVHMDRSFMHLGFHVFDLGFQSQNSEAAKPMVYTTILLLIAIIAILNLMAVWLRGSLRRRLGSQGY